LSAFTESAAIVEPLLRRPPRADAIEQVLTAARSVDMSAERRRCWPRPWRPSTEPSALPSAWAAQIRADAQAEIAKELRLDRSYQTLSARMMALAGWRAKQADVRGVERS